METGRSERTWVYSLIPRQLICTSGHWVYDLDLHNRSRSHDCHMTVTWSPTWPSQISHMTITWLSHDLPHDHPWLSHDCHMISHMTITWPSHDCHMISHMTITWLSHDLPHDHINITWLSHDRHMTGTCNVHAVVSYHTCSWTSALGDTACL